MIWKLLGNQQLFWLWLSIMPSDELHYTTCSLNVMIVLRKLSTLQHLQSHLQLAKINVTSSNYALITLQIYNSTIFRNIKKLKVETLSFFVKRLQKERNLALSEMLPTISKCVFIF